MSSPLPEILIVDDSATVRASIGKFLGEDYIKHMAEDGQQGWDQLQQHENIALVFADMQMPVLNGMQLLQRIRQSDCERIASVPVVMITGASDTRAAKRAAHTLGASEFLGKPHTREDILMVADSFTRLDRRIAEYSEDPTRNSLISLDNNRALMEFGNKSVKFANDMDTDTAILYAEIAEIKAVAEEHGSKAAEQISQKIAEILQESVRKDEFMARIDEGRYVLVLPMTKAFKAHIVANRLKRAARSVEFDTGASKIRINLAIGLTSTESVEGSINLGFKDFCLQAALALRASLESPNYSVVRYDETYEKQFENLPASIEASTVENEHIDSSLEEFGEFFSGILIGDYSSIPESYLPTLIEPLEKFLEYARTRTGNSTDVA